MISDSFASIIDADAQRLAYTRRHIDVAQVEALGRAILVARHVFVAGSGRTGLVLRMFAAHLAQLALRVHVVGDSTTPGIGRGDLLVSASPSGNSRTLVDIACAAVAANARVAAVTTSYSATIAKLGDVMVLVPLRPSNGNPATASAIFDDALFDQVLLAVLDVLAVQFARIQNERFDVVLGRRPNLE